MRKFLTFLIALAGIVLGVCSPASAQGFNGGGFNVGLGPLASGGGTPTFTPDAAPAIVNVGFGSTTTFSSLTVGAGVTVIGVGQDYNGAAISSVTGSSGCGSPTFTLLSDTTQHRISFWYATTTAGTCNITVNGSGLNDVGIVYGHFTGASTVGTPGLFQYGNVASPPSITATITAGGVGVIMGAAQVAGCPTTWTNTTSSSGDFCTQSALGNTLTMFMAHTTATGSQTVTVTGTSFVGSTAMIMNGWSP